MQAISAVGRILENYDSNKAFPVIGFGALIPGVTPESKASHCFAINGDIFNPEIFGMTNVENAYKKCLSSITLHGPTYFSQLIQFVNNMAEFDIVSGYANLLVN